MWEKFKRLPEDELLFTTILIFLVGIISFGLGRQSIGDVSVAQPAGIIMSSPGSFVEPIGPENNVTSALMEEGSTVTSGQYVASRSGSRYHLLDCPSAQQIKDENKVYFETQDAAEAAGYTKAANCPGL